MGLRSFPSSRPAPARYNRLVQTGVPQEAPAVWSRTAIRHKLKMILLIVVSFAALC